ncbi:hypothetical protein HGRIS_007338 [Hohenbuehelia grisea]|uniref:Uncharacterized protein n=1 Tax=Hohenbuehelia grisea TaxID=104357 RepID=A0ABR3J5W9_9AGAR
MPSPPTLVRSYHTRVLLPLWYARTTRAFSTHSGIIVPSAPSPPTLVPSYHTRPRLPLWYRRTTRALASHSGIIIPHARSPNSCIVVPHMPSPPTLLTSQSGIIVQYFFAWPLVSSYNTRLPPTLVSSYHTRLLLPLWYARTTRAFSTHSCTLVPHAGAAPTLVRSYHPRPRLPL